LKGTARAFRRAAAAPGEILVRQEIRLVVNILLMATLRECPLFRDKISWLAAPIVGQDGTNWGLLQLSDKCEGEFTEEDEKYFISFAKLVSEALEALWNVRELRKSASAG
jgi:GAF domain-containing protein